MSDQSGLPFSFSSFFETESHLVALVGLELTMETRQPQAPKDAPAGSKGVCHQTLPG